MVRVQLLGEVAAVTDGGEPLDVGPAKCRALLAALALSVGEAVPVSRLVDVVWGDDPPRTAGKTLQGYVAQLRRSLGPETIVRVGTAYRLDVDPDRVDAARFRRALASGDIDEALAAWTGTPLAGLDVPGLAAAAEGLVEQWLGAVEKDLQRRADTHAAEVVAPLTELTADHPFREESWALLMTALYRAGRQADALAAFQRAREHLVSELGVEPGPRLRDLEARILRHDDDLGTHRFEGVGDQEARQLDDGYHPPLRTASVRRGNLPRQLGRLVGRDAELDAVAETTATSPVVTLVGPGGVGKTALALAVARRSEADGRRRVWLVELAGVADSGDVAHAVAETLGVTGGGGRTLTESVVAALRARPTVLVLDNCEHVIEGAAALARAVADGGADTQLLATSREGLGIPGEQLITVASLDPAAAVELFTERARAVSATFDPDATRTEVEEICRRLDGLPLAVELAAARSASLTPAELLSRLDDRLRLLGGSRRTGAERHRTLRATVQWSYDLLTPAQQKLFEQLAVFAGPFHLAAAETVAEDAGGDTDYLLGDLVDRSIVTVESGPFGRRFRLLETLRQFASERLTAHGSVDEVAGRHARWCRDEISHIRTLLTGHREVEGVTRLAELWPNLRAAVNWACATGDRALADALVRPIAPEVNLRRQAEIAGWAERILDLTPADDETGVVFWLLWALNRHMQAGDHAAYDRLVQHHGHTDHPVIRFTHAYLYDDGEDGYASSCAAVAWLREQDENHAANLVEVAGVASYLMALGRFSELDALASTMAERYRELGPPTLAHFALGMLGYSAQFQGRREDAASIFTESASIDVPAGTYMASRPVEARIVFEQGERTRAFRMLGDHVDDLLDSDYTDVARMAAVEFVPMMAAVGRHAEAARVLTYLDTTGEFGVLARDTLIADAVHRIGADAGHTGDDRERDLDARGALAFMRDALHELAVDA